MKKIFIVFILSFSIILIGCNNSNKNNISNNGNQIKKNNFINKNLDTKNSKTIKYFSIDEVSKHNQPGKDCWTIISGKVYNITPFFGIHPGGDDKIAKLCGLDGTTKFIKKHGNNTKALNKLKSFYIGKLKE